MAPAVTGSGASVGVRRLRSTAGAAFTASWHTGPSVSLRGQVADCDAGVYCAQTVVLGGGVPATGAPVRLRTPVAAGWKSTSNPSDAFWPAPSVAKVQRR